MLDQLDLAHRIQRDAREHRLGGRADRDDAGALGDGPRCLGVVAGDQDDADAGGVAARQGVGHLVAQRVRQAQEAVQLEAELQLRLGGLDLVGP